MFDVIQYQPEHKGLWDDCVRRSRNGTFLFFRDYMDYHSDRFRDYSFLVFKKGNLEAVFPANISDNAVYSHQGLTYGGLVMSPKIRMEHTLTIFQLLNEKFESEGFEKVIYKTIPYIYHTIPTQEDLYALFRLNAEKIGCCISSVIDLRHKIPFMELRTRGAKKAEKKGIQIFESEQFDQFWHILNENLTGKYAVLPVHTLNEMQYLKLKFPDNIKLYVAAENEQVVAGTVIYEMDNVAHVQYISANELGRQHGALDLIFEKLIDHYYAEKKFFDFGGSTERGGEILNESLIFQKEGFGARGVAYEIYQYQLKKHNHNHSHSIEYTTNKDIDHNRMDFLTMLKSQNVRIDSTSDVKSTSIGNMTTIWQYCTILANAVIGKHCNINSYVFIENDVTVGDNVTIKCGVQLWDGIRVEDNVFIGPNVTFTNDRLPRSKKYPDHFLQTTIRKGASIGANATILGGITIGSYAMIGAGSVVTKDIPDYSLWYGNPACLRGYICQCGNKLNPQWTCSHCGQQFTQKQELIQPL